MAPGKMSTLMSLWSAAHRSWRGILNEYSARTTSVGTGFDSHSESYQNLTVVTSLVCTSTNSPSFKSTSPDTFFVDNHISLTVSIVGIKLSSSSTSVELPPPARSRCQLLGQRIDPVLCSGRIPQSLKLICPAKRPDRCPV